MTDDDGVAVTTERVVERVGVSGQGPRLVHPIGGHARGRVATTEWRDRAVPALGEAGQQMPPRVGGVREPVEAQRERSVTAGAEVGELEFAGLHAPRLDPRCHAPTVALCDARHLLRRSSRAG